MLEFFSNNLIWFIIGFVISLFALIGYFAENGFRGKKPVKSMVTERANLENEQLELLKQEVPKQSLSQIVQGGSSNNQEEVSQEQNEVNQVGETILVLDDNKQSGVSHEQVESLNTDVSEALTPLVLGDNK